MSDGVWVKNDFSPGDRLAVDGYECVVLLSEDFETYPIDVRLLVVHVEGECCTKENPCVVFPNVAHTDYEKASDE